MDRHRVAPTLLPTLLLLLLPVSGAAQSAADVLRDVREDLERRTSRIEDYTVVQKVMGQETTAYFVRDEVDGIVVFRPEDTGDMPEEAEAGGPSPDPAFLFRPDAADRMTHEGMADVGGHACHELALEDFEGLDLERFMSTGGSGFTPEALRLCIDEDEHVVRRMVMKGTARGAGEARPMEMTVVMSDYRDVEGMLHPFRVEMTTTGLESMAPSGEMAQAMAEMRKQLEQLPEAQRKQVEEMMRSRMEAMEGAMGAMAGEPLVIETLEVRVNAGPPAGG